MDHWRKIVKNVTILVKPVQEHKIINVIDVIVILIEQNKMMEHANQTQDFMKTAKKVLAYVTRHV